MKNIKTITMALTVMTTFTFADFTVKDLFVSGGTQSEESTDTKDGQKDEHKERTHHDCQ